MLVHVDEAGDEGASTGIDDGGAGRRLQDPITHGLDERACHQHRHGLPGSVLHAIPDAGVANQRVVQLRCGRLGRCQAGGHEQSEDRKHGCESNHLFALRTGSLLPAQRGSDTARSASGSVGARWMVEVG